jgi:hypothetical protein
MHVLEKLSPANWEIESKVYLWETKEALAVVHDDMVMTETKEGSSSIDMTIYSSYCEKRKSEEAAKEVLNI